jgi:hypothetical protein
MTRTHKHCPVGPGQLPGFAQTIGIVTPRLFLVCVGFPSCRTVSLPFILVESLSGLVDTNLIIRTTLSKNCSVH